MELPGISSINEGLLSGDAGYDTQENDHLLNGGYYDQWTKPITNLDAFFIHMYHYYVSKGLPHIILTQLCDIITLGFTVAFSVFLVLYVKWSAFLHNDCHDEASCGGVSDYLISSPFWYHSVFFSILMFFYIVLFTGYWVWKAISAVSMVSNAVYMERFYREKLGISLRDLPTLSWSDVIHRVIMLHEHGIYKVCVNKEHLSEHDIVLRIMRKENYMIAMINKKCLDIHMPWWAAPFLSDKLFLTKSLEWSLSFCILDFMFDDVHDELPKFTISTNFVRNVPDLQRRFFLLGLFHLALLPFALIFMVIHFFLQNAQQFHSTKAYLGPRQWSPLALWTFREFNELQHVFDDRINKSYPPANEYLKHFHNPYVAAMARFIAYISGSFVAVLLLISVISEGVVLYVIVADHNLLWYLGIFSAIYAAARSFIPEENINVVGYTGPSVEDLLEHVGSFTHYSPMHWVGRYGTNQVKEEFEELFPYKVQLFAMEMLSVLLTPMVLCFSMPDNAQRIVNFIREHSRYVDGLGHVCDYSLFDFDTYGDEKYGAPITGRMHESKRLMDGKLEQSYLNFRRVHPNWQGDSIGQAMEERLRYFKAAKDPNYDDQSTCIYDHSPQGTNDGPENEVPENLPTSYGASGQVLQRNQQQYMQHAYPGTAAILQPIASHRTLHATSGGAASRQSSIRSGEGSDIEQPSSENDNQNSHSGHSRSNNSYTSHASMSPPGKLTIQHSLNGPPGPKRRESTPTALSSPPRMNTMMIKSTWLADRNVFPTVDSPENQNANSAGNQQASASSGTGTSTRQENVPRSNLPVSGDNRMSLQNQAAMEYQQYTAMPQRNNTTPAKSSGGPVTAPRPAEPHRSLALSSSHSGFDNTKVNFNAHAGVAATRTQQYIHQPPAAIFGTRMDSPPRNRLPPNTSKGDIPSVLRSVLRQENIDYENDFYWLNKFQKQRARDPSELEKSLLQSKMMLSQLDPSYILQLGDTASLSMTGLHNQTASMFSNMQDMPFDDDGDEPGQSTGDQDPSKAAPAGAAQEEYFDTMSNSFGISVPLSGPRVTTQGHGGQLPNPPDNSKPKVSSLETQSV